MKIVDLDTSKNKLQNVKQRFFALRNGIVADSLRNAGSPYRIIFGLNLPQLKEVAAPFGKDQQLADMLWDNETTRESRLMAPMVADVEVFDATKAEKWIETLKGCAEEVDILCHELLRRTGFHEEIAAKYIDSEDAVRRYLALRLMFQTVARRPGEVLDAAKAELVRNEPFTKMIAFQLIEEAEFLMER